MSLWNRIAEIDALLGGEVSILVLVDVALELSYLCRNIGDFRKFQSLFSWMSLWNETDLPRGPGTLGVSILVLVDVALEPIVMIIKYRFEPGFNPCSRGCRSGTSASTPLVPR